jgi:hypothetical protein
VSTVTTTTTSTIAFEMNSKWIKEERRGGIERKERKK